MSSAVIRTWNFDDAIFMMGLCSAPSKWVRLGRRITLYAGDVARGAMFFVLFCAVRPTLSTARAWLAAVVTTELVEFSQLYHAPWLDALRPGPTRTAVGVKERGSSRMKSGSNSNSIFRREQVRDREIQLDVRNCDAVRLAVRRGAVWLVRVSFSDELPIFVE